MCTLLHISYHIFLEIQSNTLFYSVVYTSLLYEFVYMNSCIVRVIVVKDTFNSPFPLQNKYYLLLTKISRKLRFWLSELFSKLGNHCTSTHFFLKMNGFEFEMQP